MLNQCSKEKIKCQEKLHILLYVLRSNMKKSDIILISVILCIAIVTCGVYYMFIRKPGVDVVVTVDGVREAVYPLSTDIDVIINSEGGGTNHFVIKDGYAQVTEASCPDKVCVHQKSIHNTGETIVCLPNKVVVSIEGGKQATLDGVAN